MPPSQCAGGKAGGTARQLLFGAPAALLAGVYLAVELLPRQYSVHVRAA